MIKLRLYFISWLGINSEKELDCLHELENNFRRGIRTLFKVLNIYKFINIYKR